MPEISEERLARLEALEKAARGVFVVNTGKTPPPGPKEDTPAKRLKEKKA